MNTNTEEYLGEEIIYQYNSYTPDALIYSSVDNNMTETSYIDTLNQLLQPRSSLPVNNLQHTYDQLNSLIDQTALKRACCLKQIDPTNLNNYSINVRLPMPSNYTPNSTEMSLINNKYNTENSKLLCVVCNYIELKNNTKKVYKIFESGFSNNTICYINNLENIILQFINNLSGINTYYIL